MQCGLCSGIFEFSSLHRSPATEWDIQFISNNLIELKFNWFSFEFSTVNCTLDLHRRILEIDELCSKCWGVPSLQILKVMRFLAASSMQWLLFVQNSLNTLRPFKNKSSIPAKNDLYRRSCPLSWLTFQSSFKMETIWFGKICRHVHCINFVGRNEGREESMRYFERGIKLRY